MIHSLQSYFVFNSNAFLVYRKEFIREITLSPMPKCGWSSLKAYTYSWSYGLWTDEPSNTKYEMLINLCIINSWCFSPYRRVYSLSRRFFSCEVQSLEVTSHEHRKVFNCNTWKMLLFSDLKFSYVFKYSLESHPTDMQHITSSYIYYTLLNHASFPNRSN